MGNELPVLEFDNSKLDLIKRTVAKGATQDEFELFLHACKRTGLDPLMKQIHAVKRWSAADQRETMAIQTGIDGYRLIAERTGKYAGNDEPVFEEGPGHPLKATVTVWKMVDGQRCPFTASARWEEYAQKKKDGTLTSFWQRMSHGQLAKCAESLALRKAFPAELSGVYTHEEMEQADTPIQITKPVIEIPQVRPPVGNRDFGLTPPPAGTTIVHHNSTPSDNPFDDPYPKPTKPAADGPQSQEAIPPTAEAQPRRDDPLAQSPSALARQIADNMDDQYDEGIISNFVKYQGVKAYQAKVKPGYFDLEDGQGGLVRKFKYFDPDLDVTSGLKRVYYRTENYQGKVSYAVTKIEALD